MAKLGKEVFIFTRGLSCDINKNNSRVLFHYAQSWILILLCLFRHKYHWLHLGFFSRHTLKGDGGVRLTSLFKRVKSGYLSRRKSVTKSQSWHSAYAFDKLHILFYHKPSCSWNIASAKMHTPHQMNQEISDS